MLKIFPHLKSLFFDPQKTSRFVVSLIVPRKRKLFDGLQIHPEKILRRTKKIDRCVDKARKARKESAQGA